MVLLLYTYIYGYEQFTILIWLSMYSHIYSHPGGEKSCARSFAQALLRACSFALALWLIDTSAGRPWLIDTTARDRAWPCVGIHHYTQCVGIHHYTQPRVKGYTTTLSPRSCRTPCRPRLPCRPKKGRPRRRKPCLGRQGRRGRRRPRRCGRQ